MLSEYRKKILKRIDDCESKGLFDQDVEDDPPFTTLMPNQVDYLNKKLSSKILTPIVNNVAISFYEKEIKKGKIVIGEIHGLENVKKVSGGAVITCNHFSIYDNYVIYRSIRKILKKHKLYKVIREGNYTGFKGLFGLFFRHCNTLPLSSNVETMVKFMKSVDILLKRGEKVLIFPEQAMWWNYRKPRPVKNGAYKFAVKANVPVIPSFITLKDTDKIDDDGYPVQEYSVWFLEPIYKDEKLSNLENQEYMRGENFRVWKELYEKVYGIPLKYEK